MIISTIEEQKFEILKVLERFKFDIKTNINNIPELLMKMDGKMTHEEILKVYSGYNYYLENKDPRPCWELFNEIIFNIRHEFVQILISHIEEFIQVKGYEIIYLDIDQNMQNNFYVTIWLSQSIFIKTILPYFYYVDMRLQLWTLNYTLNKGLMETWSHFKYRANGNIYRIGNDGILQDVLEKFKTTTF